MSDEGVAKVKYVGSAGQAVPQGRDVGYWNFLYRKSTVKDPGYNVGDRVVLPDGRVCRYGKSSDTGLNTDLLCTFAEDEVQGWEALKESQVVGDMQVTFTGAAHAAVAEDELRGGYVIIFHDGGGGFTQFRGIVSNTESALNSNITVYLDAPLDVAIIGGTTAGELWYNPYAALAGDADLSASAAGRPMVNVDAADTYFWIQTWGPCWLSPQNAGFAAAKQRSAVKRSDGSIQAIGAEGVNDVTQVVGFLINEGFTSGPLFMLQISP